MQENITGRLEELSNEYETGRTRLAELEAAASDLRQTLLRIEGAMIALRELTGEQPAEDAEALSASAENGAVSVGAEG